MTGFHRAVAAMCVLLSVSCAVRGDEVAKPPPTRANVRYGPHERNVLDFWQAPQKDPAPLAIHIHGGAFRAGSKEGLRADVLRELLAAGVAVASINYRYVPQDPLPAAHHDARRALQFLRSHAADWYIDKSRVAAFGGSAGAQLSLYLGFHDEQANPGSNDPVERESTRLTCVGSTDGQTTLDVDWRRSHIPGYDDSVSMLMQRIGLTDDASYRALVADTAALTLISADDPPLWMSYSMSPDSSAPADPEKAYGWRVHHVQFGIALKQKMDALQVESHLVYPGSEDGRYPRLAPFLIEKLTRLRPAGQ